MVNYYIENTRALNRLLNKLVVLFFISAIICFGVSMALSGSRVQSATIIGLDESEYDGSEDSFYNLTAIFNGKTQVGIPFESTDYVGNVLYLEDYELKDGKVYDSVNNVVIDKKEDVQEYLDTLLSENDIMFGLNVNANSTFVLLIFSLAVTIYYTSYVPKRQARKCEKAKDIEPTLCSIHKLKLSDIGDYTCVDIVVTPVTEQKISRRYNFKFLVSEVPESLVVGSRVLCRIASSKVAMFIDLDSLEPVKGD